MRKFLKVHDRLRAPEVVQGWTLSAEVFPSESVGFSCHKSVYNHSIEEKVDWSTKSWKSTTKSEVSLAGFQRSVLENWSRLQLLTFKILLLKDQSLCFRISALIMSSDHRCFTITVENREHGSAGARNRFPAVKGCLALRDRIPSIIHRWINLPDRFQT